MNRRFGVTYRVAALKPGDTFNLAEDGIVREAKVLWTYFDHVSVEVNGRVRLVSFDEAEYPRNSMAARAVMRTEAEKLYPGRSPKAEDQRERYVEDHWHEVYPAIVAGCRDWQARQTAPIETERELSARWVLSVDKHAGTEYQFRERREVSTVQEAVRLRQEIERQASTANWSLCRERILSQPYQWPSTTH